ncbi:uncharacterized protein BJ171DRAFT_585782 [Polychytrium aggregatum]|uniref:uncharacterized protein n=1 Tax=Polychytrium aggregatum TaxID=110093 RepID=UPI0022FDCE7D|nr:uncharacterized protein BJ171DRAFT_585782 [Polychytrium aggregatum]KAI9197269.1 hypothetical protein BJ171DRAFT_585782 [Polychytrium aggregatum]
MPKIISSSIISASDHQNEKPLHVYYCICGEYVLIIDKEIDYLPKRPTDRSYVLTNKRVFRFNTVDGPTVVIKRPSGFEKQCRRHCPRCQLPIAYHQNGENQYLIDGSVTLEQGGIPEGLGEHLGKQLEAQLESQLENQPEVDPSRA